MQQWLRLEPLSLLQHDKDSVAFGILKYVICGTKNPAELGTKHIAVSILNKHCSMVGLGSEHDKDERRHHVQSANSISPINSTDSTSKSTFPSLSLVVPELQASTTGAEHLNADSIVCRTDDTEALIHDSGKVSMSQVVLVEGNILLVIGMLTLLNLLMMLWTCFNGQPIWRLCFRPSHESSLEEDDQVPDILPSGPNNLHYTVNYNVLDPTPKRMLGWDNMLYHAYQIQFV
eukprot:6455107-Amphidinium_carterae.2